MGWHSLCEHALPDKIISSGACGTDRFRRLIIRVWYCPPQEVLRTACGGSFAASTRCASMSSLAE